MTTVKPKQKKVRIQDERWLKTICGKEADGAIRLPNSTDVLRVKSTVFVQTVIEDLIKYTKIEYGQITISLAKKDDETNTYKQFLPTEKQIEYVVKKILPPHKEYVNILPSTYPEANASLKMAHVVYEVT